MKTVSTYLRAAWVLALAAAALGARAQLIDEVNIRAAGGDVIVQVRFTAPVQYLRTASVPSGEVVQAFYDVLPPRDGLNLEPGQRRVVGGGELPRVTITDESVAAAGASRKLVVRFAAPQRAQVRAGAGNRVIELVLRGAARRAPPPVPAPSVPAVPAASAPAAMPAASSAVVPAVVPAAVPASAPPPERYVIVLRVFAMAGQEVATPVPRTLQDYTVFTERHQVGEYTVYDINVGYFDSRRAAERALKMLGNRFPDALIVDLNQPRPPIELPPWLRTARVPAAASAPDAPASATAAAPPAPAAAASASASVAAVAPAPATPAALPAAPVEPLPVVPAPASASAPSSARAEPPPRPRARQRAPIEPSTTLTGSLAQFYYGGQSKVRTQEFQDSPLSGLPELVADDSFSGTDQKQSVTSLDLNWRHRDAERDMRFVFRDTYSADLLRDGRNRNRLSALYFDHRSASLGTNIRVGRQSGTGGGVLGRFDGVQGGYLFAPSWRVNAVAGQPADKLLSSKRRFFGSSVDAEALTPELSGSLYVIQQTLDGEVDRRAVGSELRYFSGGVSAFGMLDYDQLLRGLNIAMLQGTWQREDNTVVNLLLDRRATPMLALGNALFFQTASPPAQSLRELLASGATVGDLRRQVQDLNSYTTQAVLGATTPLSKRWQLGGDLRATDIGEISPVPELLPYGQKPTRVWSVGTQLIGTNLYSPRDTHVFGLTWLKGSTQVVTVADPAAPAFQDSTYTAVLLNYHNASLLSEALTLEPSIKLYRQTDNAGLKTTRWTPGVRLSYRLGRQLSAESELTSEFSKTTSPARNESSNRVYYYLGARYDF